MKNILATQKTLNGSFHTSSKGAKLRYFAIKCVWLEEKKKKTFYIDKRVDSSEVYDNPNVNIL